MDREFDGHDFRDDDLSRLRTERVVFTECDFSGVDLSESEHLGSAFRNCNFRRTSLLHSTFRHCSLLGSVFTECRMRPMTMIEVDLTLAVLGGCDLRGVDLSDCRLREASLVGADLRKAVLRRADLSGARTQDARLDDADLRGARIDPTFWTTAKLRGAKDRHRPGAGLRRGARPRRPRRVSVLGEQTQTHLDGRYGAFATARAADQPALRRILKRTKLR